MQTVDWSLMGQPVNYGEKFMQGMQAGQKMVEQREQKNALAAFAQNPDDPRAIGSLMRVDPKLGYSLYQDQRERAAAQAKVQREQQAGLTKTIGHLAKASKDAATWDATVDFLVANGVPNAAAYKGKFSPEARTALMAQAGVDESSADQDPSQVRMYEWLKANKPELADQYIQGVAAGPPMVIDNGDGTKTIMQRPMLTPTNAAPGPTDDVPTVASPEEAKRLPPGSPFKTPDGRLMRVPGGATAGPSRTFP